MGLFDFTIGNGALFWGLTRLPATTSSFLNSLLPIPALLLGMALLREMPTRWQIVGLFAAVEGNVLFFSPSLEPGQPLGLAAVGLAVLSFAAFSILTRQLARDRQVHPLALTAFPLAFGGGILLTISLLGGGWPHVSLQGWGYILLLSGVHTVGGYLLYNYAYEELTALEMNVLLNLIPLGTVFWAWLFLDERLVWPQPLGMFLTVGGMALVQAMGRPRH